MELGKGWTDSNWFSAHKYSAHGREILENRPEPCFYSSLSPGEDLIPSDYQVDD